MICILLTTIIIVRIKNDINLINIFYCNAFMLCECQRHLSFVESSRLGSMYPPITESVTYQSPLLYTSLSKVKLKQPMVRKISFTKKRQNILTCICKMRVYKMDIQPAYLGARSNMLTLNPPLLRPERETARMKKKTTMVRSQFRKVMTSTQRAGNMSPDDGTRSNDRTTQH